VRDDLLLDPLANFGAQSVITEQLAEAVTINQFDGRRADRSTVDPWTTVTTTPVPSGPNRGSPGVWSVEDRATG
jgi:hypothetical protein